MPTPDGCLGTEAEEVGRQQVYYLSQSEGEDLARRPCRLRDCPRHEGTQALRSLWAKRTELLRTGTGGARRPARGTQSQRCGGSSPRQQESSFAVTNTAAGCLCVCQGVGTCQPCLPGCIAGPVSTSSRVPTPRPAPPLQPQRGVPGDRLHPAPDSCPAVASS